MPNEYEDGDWSQAGVNGHKHVVYPFEGDNVSYYTEQQWMQLRANFAPLVLNSPDPDDPLCFLTGERELNDETGNIVSWTRVYSRIPMARNEFESFVYTFPGWVASYDSTYHSPWASAGVSILPYFPITPAPTLIDPGRIPEARTVTSRIAHEYFMVGPNGAFASTDLIPLQQAQRFVYGDSFGGYGGGDVPDKVLWPEDGYTSPTSTEYKALIAAGTELVAESAILRRWKGQIFERVTRYVKAE